MGEREDVMVFRHGRWLFVASLVCTYTAAGRVVESDIGSPLDAMGDDCSSVSVLQ